MRAQTASKNSAAILHNALTPLAMVHIENRDGDGVYAIEKISL